MTPERWRDVSRIYGAVLTKAPDARVEFLRDVCKDDEELRREVESLLNADNNSVILDRPAGGVTGVLEGVRPRIGSQLGAFRIDGLLGVGGMGEVSTARISLTRWRTSCGSR